MPIGWLQPIEQQELKQWAYLQFSKRNVMFAADRATQYPCTVAEIPITDEDLDRWGKALFGVKDGWQGSMVTLIMSPKDQRRAIDDENERFTIDDINFDGEMIG